MYRVGPLLTYIILETSHSLISDNYRKTINLHIHRSREKKKNNIAQEVADFDYGPLYAPYYEPAPLFSMKINHSKMLLALILFNNCLVQL